MTPTQIEAIDNYWRTITRNEEFIRRHGHTGCPDWEDRWHQDLEDAYLEVQPQLAPVTERQIFHGLPGELNPFEAENYHHALCKFLNPPEYWFGKVGVLRSPEYLALKNGAENEELLVGQSQNASASANAEVSPLSGLNDTMIAILEAMDRQEPRNWNEISRKAGYTHDVVRRYSARLQKAELIRKVPGRGFIRLIPMPNEDCGSL